MAAEFGQVLQRLARAPAREVKQAAGLEQRVAGHPGRYRVAVAAGAQRALGFLELAAFDQRVDQDGEREPGAEPDLMRGEQLQGRPRVGLRVRHVAAAERDHPAMHDHERLGGNGCAPLCVDQHGVPAVLRGIERVRRNQAESEQIESSRDIGLLLPQQFAAGQRALYVRRRLVRGPARPRALEGQAREHESLSRRLTRQVVVPRKPLGDGSARRRGCPAGRTPRAPPRGPAPARGPSAPGCRAHPRSPPPHGPPRPTT